MSSQETREPLAERLKRLKGGRKLFERMGLKIAAKSTEESIEETKRALEGDINAQANILVDEADSLHEQKIVAVAQQVLDGEVGFHPQSVAKALRKELKRKPTEEEISHVMITSLIGFKAEQTDSGEE